jgi:hypothetical protein
VEEEKTETPIGDSTPKPLVRPTQPHEILDDLIKGSKKAYIHTFSEDTGKHPGLQAT